jgi:subtilisin family serine protease
VAIFDTGYAEGVIPESRLVDTFYGDMVDSVYAPSEGHGTMTAGAAAADSDDDRPYNGAAPDAGVILVRITDDKGQIRSDITAQAWDWLTDLDLDRPIIANHSYGIPICSGRPKQSFCNGPLRDVIDVANEDPMLTSCYAAGNEAGTCGRRPSGITNAITGINSIDSVITWGAMLTNQEGIQRYSSHGRGDCAPVADPKPNMSLPIPKKCYYGVEGGWKIKDMSTGIFGSSGGTSHASPYGAGQLALLQSKSMKENGEPLETEELKNLAQDVSEPPRRTQINMFGLTTPKGYDSRFGHGMMKINKALDRI